MITAEGSTGTANIKRAELSCAATKKEVHL